MPVRGYLSSVINCPYDGGTNPRQVARIADDLIRLGCYEVSLGDTIGADSAQTVDALLDHVLDIVPPQQLAGHFHDTSGTALEMTEAALQRGLRTFDGSIAGIGGCPYAPGAPGNVDTAKLYALVTELGFETGLNADALARAESLARQTAQ